MRCISFVLAILMACHVGLAKTPASQTTQRAARADQHRVVIISVDGMRPDVMLRADMPNLRVLLAAGSFSFWAQTIPESITLPSHTSMLTGVSPQKHHITWNDDRQDKDGSFPDVPTLFEIAHEAGLSTALVSGKTKFVALNKPGTIDYPMIRACDDATVAETTAKLISSQRPELLVVHFPGADGTGHAAGWGSPAQVAALEKIDKAIGVVLDSLDKAKVRDQTLIIISADHGGAGRTHGPDDPRSRHIPWIAVGPGVRKNYDLTMNGKLTIRTMDTFATACKFLGLAPGDVDGKPVMDIFEQRELMQEAK